MAPFRIRTSLAPSRIYEHYTLFFIFEKEIVAKLLKPIVQDALADIFDKLRQKADVVHAGQYRPEHFVRPKQMVYIRLGVMLAYGAVALFVDRRKVLFILGVWYLYLALLSVEAARAAVAGRHHAVKGVHAGGNAYQNIFGLADAKQMFWFFFGQFGVYFVQDP
jgi:hypothetical protein